MKFKTYEEAREFCMSYAPIEIKGKYYYPDQDVINMLINLYEVEE